MQPVFFFKYLQTVEFDFTGNLPFPTFLISLLVRENWSEGEHASSEPGASFWNCCSCFFFTDSLIPLGEKCYPPSFAYMSSQTRDWFVSPCVSQPEKTASCSLGCGIITVPNTWSPDDGGNVFCSYQPVRAQADVFPLRHAQGSIDYQTSKQLTHSLPFLFFYWGVLWDLVLKSTQREKIKKMKRW